MHDNTLFVAVHSPKSHHKSITFSVTVQLCDKMLFFFKCGPYSFRKSWNDVIGNDREFAIHNMNEWLLSSRFVYIAYIDMFSPHFPMTWRHDKIVRQRRSCATSCHSFITTVWWYNILYQTGYFLYIQRKMLDNKMLFPRWCVINKKQYLGEVIFQAMKTSTDLHFMSEIKINQEIFFIF